jgi:adenylate cyclase
MAEYTGLQHILSDIEGNRDVQGAEGPKAEAQSSTPPRIVFSIALKLMAFFLPLIIAIIAILTAVVLLRLQEVQVRAMEGKGKIMASQSARAMYEGLTQLFTDDSPANRDMVVKLNVQPPSRELIKVEDVVYIRVYDARQKLLWKGGEGVDFVEDSAVPFYADENLAKGGGEIIVKVGARALTELSPMAALLNRVARQSNTIYDISGPVTREGESRKVGEVHVGFSRERVSREILSTLQSILTIALGFIGISIVISILISLIFTRPITRLKNVMVRVGHGDLSQRVKISGRDEVGLLTWNFNRMVDEIAEKEKMRASFGKAVSEEIVEVMMSGELFLGGEEKAVTMLFSDIRSFTKTSGSLTPSGVMEMLNEYFTRMEYVVNKNLGIIDKYVGDEIMAIFGATDPNQDHAENACRCAIEMILELAKLNQEREARGALPLKIGIGINTGIVTAGMLGSQNRMNYTVIGDTVNMASRLCDAGGSHGFAPIVIAEDTYDRVKDLVKVRTGHSVMAKGKARPVKIYELLGIADRKTTIELKLARLQTGI